MSLEKLHIVEVEEMCLPILKEFNFLLDHIMSFIRAVSNFLWLQSAGFFTGCVASVSDGVVKR